MKDDHAWQKLLARYLDGCADAADLAELNTRLRWDAAARADWIELFNLDSGLAALAAAAQPVALTERTRRKPLWRPRSLPQIAAIAACLALLMICAGFWLGRTDACASVAKSAGSDLTEGVTIHHERHEIDAGSVELLTSRGAKVVIEAPAAFAFDAPQRLHLFKGRAAAEVPPSAKGFTIVTPKGDAVDLGTKFGVDVTAQGESEIHVFEGEVIAKPKGGANQQSLRRGEAVTLEQGSGAAREMRNGAFIRPDEVASLSAGLIAGQRSRAETANAILRSDPSLIALLDFEGAGALPGTYRMLQGRWPGSHAPEFANVGDHVKVEVGGGRSWPRLTVAAWVRLDRLGEPYQSLYHTDGWQEDKPGQVHWMINRDTTMRLALRQNVLALGATERDGYPDSRTSVLPERGRWVHLAAVYDAEARTVRFYFNGQFDNETRLATAFPARLGPAQIGNWNQHDRKLSGRVDELLLLGRAMGDAEVQALFDAGNPYR